MGQVLHKRSTTTERTRKEIQESKESIAKIAKRFGINPKTVVKWRKRDFIHDSKMGPKKVNTVLTPIEEKIICNFRKKTRFSIDDCFIVLKDYIPKLSRSNLHRCLKRHELSAPFKSDDIKKRKKRKFKEYKIGFIHIDITAVCIGKKKYYIFVAIDRITKYAHIQVFERQTVENSIEFLENTIKAYPYKIHRILTDNGVQFTYRCLKKEFRPKKFHPFDVVCRKNFIKHKLTKFAHPWTNGQVEIFNKTLKNNTTKKYFYSSVKEFSEHIYDFLMVYNFTKKLKSLKYKTPYDKIIEEWKLHPKVFWKNPYHYKLGRNK